MSGGQIEVEEAALAVKLALPAGAFDVFVRQEVRQRCALKGEEGIEDPGGFLAGIELARFGDDHARDTSNRVCLGLRLGHQLSSEPVKVRPAMQPSIARTGIMRARFDPIDQLAAPTIITQHVIVLNRVARIRRLRNACEPSKGVIAKLCDV